LFFSSHTFYLPPPLGRPKKTSIRNIDSQRRSRNNNAE